MYCGKCGKETPDGMEYCPACELQIRTQAEAPSAAAPDLPMKWYKFLVYFALFASLVINILSGVGYIKGIHYLGMADQVYAAYPVMKFVDIAMGVYSIGYAILALATRNNLARFSKKAPAMVTWLYALPPVVSLFYAGAASLALGQSAFDGQIIGSLLYSAFLLAANIRYFKRREHMFVN